MRLRVWPSDFADLTALQRVGRWDDAGALLAEGTRGSELLAICANTMHLVADAVTDAAGDRVARALIEQGADAVVLACTEHGMVLADGDLPAPVLDSALLHVRALVAASLSA